VTIVNGRYPESALAKIPGGQLSKPYAVRWNCMCFAARALDGSCPMPNGPMSSYRTHTQQVFLRRQWCGRGQCHNAAMPGTSNHGLGRAVDNNNTPQAYKRGKPYGIRPPSDAPWEGWHVLVRTEGRTKVVPRTLRKGSRPGADVRAVQKLLRHEGYLPRKWKLNDSYSLRVRRAVRAFQKAHGLRADGVVGPKTLAALKRAAR
jgi:murein L,D-transpeptidase YcbB/YkuD